MNKFRSYKYINILTSGFRARAIAGPKPEAKAGAEPTVGTICGFCRTIISASSSHYCTSDDIISSTIRKGEEMVTSDYSLVLEIEMTINFGSQSFRLWFALLLSVQVKEILSLKVLIYRHAFFLNVIIHWNIDALSITWDSHSTQSNINLRA